MEDVWEAELTAFGNCLDGGEGRTRKRRGDVQRLSDL